MEMIPKGAKVRQIVKPIEGTVREARLNQEAGEIEYHVDYMRDDEEHAGWFLASALELAPEKKGSELKKEAKAS